VNLNQRFREITSHIASPVPPDDELRETLMECFRKSRSPQEKIKVLVEKYGEGARLGCVNLLIFGDRY
jgi:hypothetical protein